MVSIGTKLNKGNTVFEVFQIDTTNRVAHAVSKDFVFWSFPDDDQIRVTAD